MLELNVSKKDIFNGKNSSAKAEDFLNQPLTLQGFFDYEDDVVDKESGEVYKTTLICLITDKGVISSPSKTLVDSVDKLYEAFGEECIGLDVEIVPRKSNAGRTFYRLELV